MLKGDENITKILENVIAMILLAQVCAVSLLALTLNCIECKKRVILKLKTRGHNTTTWKVLKKKEPPDVVITRP